MDGFAPAPANSTWTRRVVLRKVINQSKVESQYTKDKQVFIPVEFKSHYVSSSITPFRWVDQTA
jgi:hypothetical protein